MSEPTGSQFWWTWTAEAATAIGTIGAVIVALFGGWLRAHLAAPRLEIRLGRGDKKGFRVPVLMSLDGKQIDTVGRWYHLCVENKRRCRLAKDVRLLLLKLEFPDGTIVLLTRLCQGQQATVLQLPSAPRDTIVTTTFLVVSPSLNAEGRKAYSTRGQLFDGKLDGRSVVKRSPTPFCAAARVLPAEGADPGY